MISNPDNSRNMIRIGDVEIVPFFFETHVKFVVPRIEAYPLEDNIKQQISLQYDIPVLFEQHGAVVSTSWYYKGTNHCPFGEPTIEERSKGRVEKVYKNEEGVVSNKQGPALIIKTDRHYREEWIKDGEWNRIGGPAYTEINHPTPPNTLLDNSTDPLLHKMTWGELLDCFDGDYEGKYFGKQDSELNFLPPALKRRDHYPLSFEFSVFKQREFMWAEKPNLIHRENGLPDCIKEHLTAERMYNVGTNMFRKVFTRTLIHSWHDHERQEKLHRTVGPATICLFNVRRLYKGSELVDIKADDWDWDWKIEGKTIPKLKILQWAKKHSVPLKKGPLYGDESMFYNLGDEVCFLADFS